MARREEWRVSTARSKVRRRRVLHVNGVLLWVLAASLAAIAQDAARPEGEPRSRFVRTVEYLQDASPEARSAFAITALSHLAGAYGAEARLARNNGQGAGLRAWSATVDQYASQIQLLLDDVELGLPVRLVIEGDSSLAISVADRTVILSHPRLSQQGALEQDILKDFCSTQDCEAIQPHLASLEPIPASAARIRPSWNFTERGSNCSYRGITVTFRSDLNTANARVICEQLLQEVEVLYAELAGQSLHGVEIQWEQLDIRASPGRPEHAVRLNALGDSVLVIVPLLYASPGLLQQVLPWFRQALENAPPVSIELDADSFGWQKP